MIIADITRASADDEPFCLKQLALYKSKNGNAQTQVICNHTQKTRIDAQFKTEFSFEFVQGRLAWQAVVNHIRTKIIIPTIVLPVTDEVITIISYHHKVLALESEIPEARSQQFKFLHWGKIEDKSIQPERRNYQKILNEVGLTENEILEAFQTALSAEKEAGWLNIREVLAKVNPKFSKLFNPSSALPGFVTAIVGIARNAGLIHVDASADPTNAKITLKAAVGYDAKIISSKPKGERIVVHERGKSFQAILQKAELGPFAAIRNVLFDQVEVLAKEKKHSCNSIIQRAVYNTKEKLPDRRAYPWWPIPRFLFHIFGLKMVLLGIDGKPLNPNLPGQAGETVAGLEDGWRTELEIVLLQHIIRSDSKVGAFDIPDLAAVLYNNRAEASQKLVEQLLKIMETNGLIYLNEKRYFRETNLETQQTNTAQSEGPPS